MGEWQHRRQFHRSSSLELREFDSIPTCRKHSGWSLLRATLRWPNPNNSRHNRHQHIQPSCTLSASLPVSTSTSFLLILIDHLRCGLNLKVKNLHGFIELLLDRWMDGCLLYKFDSRTKIKKEINYSFCN